MHTVTFHNLGNADSTLIRLENDRRALFDYANTRNPDNQYDLCCDLPAVLRDDLGDTDFYDVVAFTHLDRDHFVGATEYFYFDHVAAYQGDVNGKKRIKMNVMWVPAAVITEKLGSDADPEAKVIQKEARARLKAGKGIRVFSRPGRLKEWCDANGIDIEARCDLITDAGRLAPEFTLAEDGVEFFVHSPFAIRQDENTVEDRNCDALVMHATFESSGVQTKLFLSSDITHDVLSDIVRVTEAYGNSERLEWDLAKLPHHCSYLSLSDEKGKDKTKPEPMVKRFYEEYSQDRCIIVSPSDTIPQKGDERDCQEGACPPHRQAANYYRDDIVPPRDGEFVVTMEHPSKARPKPLVIEINGSKASIRKAVAAVSVAAASFRAPRAG